MPCASYSPGKQMGAPPHCSALVGGPGASQTCAPTSPWPRAGSKPVQNQWQTLMSDFTSGCGRASGFPEAGLIGHHSVGGPPGLVRRGAAWARPRLAPQLYKAQLGRTMVT
jgi:hypothetical protein